MLSHKLNELKLSQHRLKGDSDGDCQVCTASTPMFLLLLLLFVALGLAFLDWSKKHFQSARKIVIMLGIMLGQMVVCLQAVAAMSQFSLDLMDPAKSLVALLDLFSFDVETVRFTCLVNTEAAVTEYVGKLFAYPAFILLTLICFQVLRLLAAKYRFRDFLAVHGMISMSFLTAARLALLGRLLDRPFRFWCCCPCNAE